MAVFSYKYLQSIRSALTDLSSVFFSKTVFVMSGDEMVLGFINPDHVTMLREVEDLVGIATQSWFRTTVLAPGGPKVMAEVKFAGAAPIIIPKYAAHGLQPTCPDALRDRLSAWIKERVEFGYVFGDVADALGHLNDSCGNAEAMALVLPCLPTLMGRLSDDPSAKVVKRAQKLTSVKSFGALPKLPLEVKKRLHEASAIVNSVTLMLDAPVPEVPLKSATVELIGLADTR